MSLPSHAGAARADGTNLSSAAATAPSDTRSLLVGYSLEITAKDCARLAEVAAILPPGAGVSITHLPDDDLGELAATARTVRALGLNPVPHISARRLRSAAALCDFLAALRDGAAVDRVFVIAGDGAQPLGPYPDARAVIATGLLADHNIRRVGISGYPEGHPQIAADALRAAMRDKCALIAQQGLAAEIFTQFAFDASPVAAWIRRLRADGIAAPIKIGVPGPTSARALLKFAARCGVGAPTRMLTKYGISLGRLLATTTPDAFLRDLAAAIDPHEQAVSIHLYPFGGLDKAAGWAAQASARGLGKAA